MKSPNPHHRHRFPAEIISHAVWLYHLFSLSLRDVELILAERGVPLSYETVRRWCQKFGRDFAEKLRNRRPRPGERWHLDEVFIRIQGELHYLWRAMDQNGTVLDILVQNRRNAKAAKRFFKRLLRGLRFSPSVLVTDKLKSYGAAKREVMPGVEHRQSRYSTIVPRIPIADSAPGTTDAAIQVTPAGSAFPVRPFLYLWPLSPAAPSDVGQQLSRAPR
jgi:putative transposase